MTQLIIDGVYLPEASGDKYKCYPGQLSVKKDMISGRRVEEVRGDVQMIDYSYDYLEPALWLSLAAILRGHRAFPVSYLPDDGDELVTSVFAVESLTPPSFAFSRRGTPYWHNIAFTLREVDPHD